MGYRDTWGRRLGTALPATTGRHWRLAGVAVALATGLVIGVAPTADPTAGTASLVAAPLLLASPRRKSLAGLVTSIAVGALVLGAVAWVVASQTTLLPLGTTVAAGLGLAVGGGLGSVVWLLGLEETEEASTEEVTVDMAEETTERPTPEPVDLFDASPDPIVFFAGDDGHPVVMAVNAAFEGTFGVSGSALVDTPLADGLLVAEGAEDLAAAAQAGDSFDRVLVCETDDGERRMRVRLAVTRDPEDSGGYVIYTPTDRD